MSRLSAASAMRAPARLVTVRVHGLPLCCCTTVSAACTRAAVLYNAVPWPRPTAFSTSAREGHSAPFFGLLLGGNAQDGVGGRAGSVVRARPCQREGEHVDRVGRAHLAVQRRQCADDHLLQPDRVKAGDRALDIAAYPPQTHEAATHWAWLGDDG